MVTLYHTPILCFSICLQDSSTVASLILQQSLARLYTVKIIFLFCADTILQQWYSLLKNHAVYQEYDTRPDKCIKLLKLQEKLRCKLQKQHIVTFVNVVVNVAIVVSVASIAYSKIFQVFTMRMDFCSNLRNKRNISRESISNAVSGMIGIRDRDSTTENFLGNTERIESLQQSTFGGSRFY